MCDTLVALGNATQDGSVILAKNSDREPNEAHVLEYHPGAQHAPNTSVDCTYLRLPQVRETHAVLLCKPFWMWGCEMGANERGVAIGNEAVFTREPYAKSGLLGMDLMRLALERADSAQRALEIITELLAEHGQGGSCGYLHKNARYHNAFIIADTQEAWVLETAGDFWAAQRVRGVRTISNGLTIGSEYDRASPGLIEHAIERGWCRSGEDFHFARCYSDRLYTHFSRARQRQSRSTDLLTAEMGRVTPGTMMSGLRDHGEPEKSEFVPARSSMRSICMHAGDELLRYSQSTGSMVAHLRQGAPALWLTGTSAPCTSLFKPTYLNGHPLPELGPRPTGVCDPETLWWRHEALHRGSLRNYPLARSVYGQERDALEQTFLAEARALDGRRGTLSPSALATAQAELSHFCFARAREATMSWVQQVNTQAVDTRSTWLHRAYWWRQNRLAQFPGGGRGST